MLSPSSRKAMHRQAPRQRALGFTMMIIITTLVLAILLLGGCGFTPQGDAIREVVMSRGAQAFDTGLESAETYICTIASVGSVMRRYGRTQTTADAWRDICFGQEGVDLIGPK